LCAKCCVDINRSLLVAQEAGSDHYMEGKETGFGNVDAKEDRWDMFVPHTGCYLEAMTSMLHCPDNSSSSPPSLSSLAPFFSELFGGEDAEFFEYAALVSDSGSLSQRVHSDTTWQAACPVYTVFIALQDVTSDMGPTIFIPGSHTQEQHQQFRSSRHQWLSEAGYVEGAVKRGDVVIMDSRTYHCGSANISTQRRVLFYFSLLNPATSSMGGGSLFSNMLSLTLHQL
jgi:hypothetical protein